MITIELDKTRHLKFSINAISDADRVFRKEYGKSIAEFIQPGEPIIFDIARVILWAGLKWEDPSMTIEKAGDLIELWSTSGNKPEDLVKAISEGLLENPMFMAADIKNQGG